MTIAQTHHTHICPYISFMKDKVEDANNNL